MTLVRRPFTYPRAQQAVFHPLLSRAAFIAIVALSVLLIAAAVLLLPASLEECQRSCNAWHCLFEAGLMFPGIESMAVAAQFPLAAAIGHLSVLVLGVLGGISLAFAALENVDVSRVRDVRTRVRILAWFGYALLAAQFFIAAPAMNEHQRSYRFFQLVASDRTMFLFWMAAIYLFTVVVVVCVAAELSELISRRRK